MSEMILFTSDVGQTQMHLSVESGTMWLIQTEIAESFQTTKQNVSLHAKNILYSNSLLPSPLRYEGERGWGRGAYEH